MIRVLIEMQLVYPYRESLSVLLEFCAVWKSTLLFGGTYKSKAQISIPLNYFKKIFHTNPALKEYPVPSGMEGFIDSIRVKKILTE